MSRIPVSKILFSVLITISLAGLIYSARASIAAKIYNSVRFRDEEGSRGDPERAQQRAQRAHRLYPHNYYFSIWIAENCWYYRNDQKGQEVPERVAMAEAWCDRGLDQNYRKSQLRLLKARLIAREEPSRGAAFWADYVEWHFWDRYNHAALVELYSQAGELEKATVELEWVRGTKHFKHADQELQAAWRREIEGVPQKK